MKKITPVWTALGLNNPHRCSKAERETGRSRVVVWPEYNLPNIGVHVNRNEEGSPSPFDYTFERKKSTSSSRTPWFQTFLQCGRGKAKKTDEKITGINPTQGQQAFAIPASIQDFLASVQKVPFIPYPKPVDFGWSKLKERNEKIKENVVILEKGLFIPSRLRALVMVVGYSYTMDSHHILPREILLSIMEELRDSTHSLETAALSPHIASYVNRLEVEQLDVRGISGPMEDGTSTSEVSYLQFKEATQIASILGSSVRELGIYVYPLDKHNLEFLKQMKRVETLKIEQIDKISIDILVELIQGMRNLASLHLFGGQNDPNAEEYENDRLQLLRDTTATPNGAPSAETAVDTPPFRLTRLTLDRTEHRLGLLKFLLDSKYFDLGAMKDLNLTWMQAEDQSFIATLDYTFLDRLLRKVGTTLNSLTVRKIASDSALFVPLNLMDLSLVEHYTTNAVASPLQCLATLESFSITDQGYNLFDLSVCLGLLTSIPSLSLTRIHFKTLIDADEFTDMIPVSFSQPEEDPGRHWKAVDTLLRDENRFPVLKTVDITVALEFGSKASIKEMANRHTAESVDETSMQIVSLFEDTLTSLKERGLLNIEIKKVDWSLATAESVFWKWGD
ncbi:hypothetical protein K435DRAFT_806421 [Dendrothele bispora CBS 962.96]|uniref:Uncharacterized protein n=1 Tax=Dendrothele bispora (strain CBS 962.96) TaxID=1314807 RepID=A0A4S8L8D3_DENBC|nr:hypothetical protein K435DRAFT_806421 [Dendrothele bispora CBS 962.96]